MIEIKDLSLTFKNADEDHEALKAVTLDIPEGCIYGFVGSNGAGKSPLLRVISGIYRPDSGSVTIDKTEVYDRPQAKENIFFVSDETVQFSRLTVNDLKSFYQSSYCGRMAKSAAGTQGHCSIPRPGGFLLSEYRAGGGAVADLSGGIAVSRL